MQFSDPGIRHLEHCIGSVVFNQHAVGAAAGTVAAIHEVHSVPFHMLFCRLRTLCPSAGGVGEFGRYLGVGSPFAH